MSACAHTPGIPHTVTVGGVPVGGAESVVIAGPCAIESAEQLAVAARTVKSCGAAILRAGAFKPRTSPHSFQGLGHDGLDLLEQVRAELGIPVVTELLDTADVEYVARCTDAIQIGARNMHNVPLLRSAAATGLPILLKRSAGATVEEFLAAADYIFAMGSDQVILCERGIRTFETSTRNTLDIAAVPVLKQRTHLPVIVDPSHAAGNATLVPALAKAAVAAGADGLMIEVHPDPLAALSDGKQSLNPDQFCTLMNDISVLAATVGRPLSNSVAWATSI